ncbi:MAG: endonuclease III [Candidatus Caldarchaeum sp.]|nr:endonuclease III [Candidatus Caldarchaeum sp.]MDW8360375.1 endonuclease III [Candidatus Caldarchaeum sp.]
MEPEQFGEILALLRRKYGLIEKPVHVSSNEAFWVLIGAVLSHRTRDEMTDKAYKRLRERFEHPPDLAEANLKELVELVKDVGFYRQKAKRIKQISRIIFSEKGGEVPSDRDELMRLPGVGPKTADIVLSIAFGKPEVAVDTHVETVAKRLGIAGQKAGYEEIRNALKKLTNPSDIRSVNMLFVRFGREICRKPRPRCEICPITNYCKYYAERFKAPAS